jgi:hypothetical protein
MTEEEILDEQPRPRESRLQAVYHYAAEIGRKVSIGVKLLPGENLSPRLVQRASTDLFPVLAHVREAGLQRASD